jgi:transcriptional regulator with XRE-family HTH domain
MIKKYEIETSKEVKNRVYKTKEVSLHKYIGHHFRVMRKQKGVSQKEMAKIFGISKGTVSSIECGARKLTIDRLLLVCEKLNIKSSELLPF